MTTIHYHHKRTMDAILGYTGFVGSTIREGLDPETTEYYNSRNMNDIRGGTFRNVYVACIPGVKWWANKNPMTDLNTINSIIELISTIKCEKIILISTIDVHDSSRQMQTESVGFPSKQPYGENRLIAERKLMDIFGEKLFIIRLPGIFGPGIKKNIIYDLVNNHRVENINGNTAFQWYPLKWLTQDIDRFINMNSDGLKYLNNTLNLYPSPIETMDIIRLLFPEFASKVSFGKRFVYNQGTGVKGLLNYQGDIQKKYILKMIGEFVTMSRYMKCHNKMAVSNMAWLPKYDDHAIFILKRYGIKNVELVPTKYGEWGEIFMNSAKMTKKYEINGIRIYSLQSVLYGVDGSFVENPDEMRIHLDKVSKLCERIGARVIVMGSPGKRVKPVELPKIESEKHVQEVLNSVQIENPSVLMCLEPNASAYGCNIGNDLQSCIRMAKSGFYVNFDTGNFSMEKDTIKVWDDMYIKHCQVSAPFLRPIHVNDYDKMMDTTESDLFHCFQKIKSNRVMMSLECKVDKIGNLGGHIHDFVSFVSKIQN